MDPQVSIAKASLNRTRNLIFQANMGLSNVEYEVDPYKAANGSPAHRKLHKKSSLLESTISYERGRNRSCIQHDTRNTHPDQ